jgi:hypothetical protein
LLMFCARSPLKQRPRSCRPPRRQLLSK